ncbi:MAG: energy transducer TonB [Dissulfurispiraceae bacterium]
MKRYFFYSILFHILLLIVAFFLIHPKKVKEPAPFVTTLVTPEEMPKEMPKEPQKKLQEREQPRIPQLPRNLPAPQKFSAIPSSPKPAVKSSSIPSVQKPETDTSPSSAVEPGYRLERQSMSQGESNLGAKKWFQPGPPISPRSKLLDPEEIGKIARKESETSEKDTGITFDTKEYKYYGYMQRLREKIEGIWKYPAEAAQRRLNGDLYIRFTIKKDGRLGAVELVHTSGYEILDAAAIRALRDADPYWPLPDSWNQDSLTITGHFVYYYQNTYIR